MTKHQTEPEKIELPRPTECPFCQSAAIVTTSQVITTESYWRCTKCGDLWNTARSQPAPNRWGYHR